VEEGSGALVMGNWGRMKSAPASRRPLLPNNVARGWAEAQVEAPRSLGRNGGEGVQSK
jgi:hypothetical protein